MKKLISILSLILILGSATIVSAAVGDSIYYNVSITSGNVKYSDSRANYTSKAAIGVTSGSVTLVDCSTLSTVTSKKTTPVQLSPGQGATYTSVNGYGGEPVKAVFIKYNINGTFYIDGQFYYDGGMY